MKQIIKHILTLFALSYMTVFAQQPVEMVVPFAAGGGSDIFARQLQKYFIEAGNIPVVVVNKPGADGKIGTKYVLSKPEESPTLFVATSSPMVFNKIFFTVNEYDYTDFSSVAPIASAPLALTVSNKSGIKNFKEFVEAAKTRTINCGISNSIGKLNLKYIAKKLDLPNIELIPFKGASDSLTNLMSGNIDCYFDPWPVVAQQFKDGKVNVIAFTRDERYADYPAIPVLKEYIKDFVVTGWFGIAVTKNSKFAQREQILNLASQVYKDKDFVNNIKLLHYDVVKPPVNSEKWLESEYHKYEEQRRLIGIEKIQP